MRDRNGHPPHFRGGGLILKLSNEKAATGQGGGEIALSNSISCEVNFSFLLPDHVLGCRRSGS